MCSIAGRGPRLTTARGWKALLKNKQTNKQANSRQKSKRENHTEKPQFQEQQRISAEEQKPILPMPLSL